MTLALIIVDHGSVRRILANKNRVAIGPSALALDALLDRPRRNESDILLQQIRSQRAQRRDVVYYPDPAPMRTENKIVITWVNRQVANGNGRKMVALELRPAFSAINRNPQSKLRADEKKIGLDQIFFNHMRVSTNALRVLSSDEGRPRLTAVARELNVAIISADPDQSLLLGRFANGINCRVHFGRRIIHRHTARLLLLLFFRIVGGQVGRNAVPRLSVIA